MVCPTCFCSTVEDTTDLAGERDRAHAAVGLVLHARALLRARRQRAPAPARSRYRQWMTHKLATWIDQFGTSGCVGCGRCITWCPVAIDITEEVAAIRASDLREAADAARLRSCSAEAPALAGAAARAPRRRRRLRPQPASSSPATQLMREGDPADEFFVIRAGAVALETDVPGRGAVTLETLHDGELLGWSWLVPPYRDGVRRARARRPRTSIAFDGACLRGKCERRPRARLRPAASCCRDGVRRAPPGHPRCGCSTSTASVPRCRVELPDRRSGSPTRRQETARHVDARLEPADATALARFAPGQFAMLYAFGAGEVPISVSAHPAATARSCTRSAPSARSTAALCAAQPGDVARRARPVRDAAGRWRRPRAATWWSSPAGIGLAPLRPVVHELLAAPRALRRRVASSTAGARPPSCSTVDELERWRARFDVDVDVTVDVRRRRLARPRGRRHAADPARRLRPRARTWR